MKKTLTTTLFLLALPVAMAGNVLAQDAGGGPAGPSAGSKRSRPSGMPVVLTMQFAGGTMAELVAAIRADEPEANIVLANGARDAVVPPMVLKNAGLEQALEGACIAAEADYQVRVKEFRGAGQPVFSITAYRSAKTKAKAKTNKNASGASGARSAQDGQQRVFSLSGLTAKRASGMEPIKVDTVLSALQMALSEEKHQPRIRFHEDSDLLLVRGDYAQVTLVEQLLSVMRQDQDMREQRFVTMRALGEAAVPKQKLQRQGVK